MPLFRSGNPPCVVDPVPYPSGGILENHPDPSDVPHAVEPRPHPYHQARLWRQQMECDERLTRAKIAAREGISRARVTQIMNLLALPAEIQAALLDPPAPMAISDFSERFLRQIVAAGDPEDQCRRWRERVAKPRNLAQA